MSEHLKNFITYTNGLPRHRIADGYATDNDYRKVAAVDRIEELQAKVDRLCSRGIEDMRHRIEELKAERAKIKGLLDMAICPCCDGSGAYYDGHDQINQCQWCYEKGELTPIQPTEES